MEQTTSSRLSPIPPANTDDAEDVAWALSTAEAMYARGERTDALKWLRRAAEAASECETDQRALELAKAMADLASEISPAPAPSPVPQSYAPPAAVPPRLEVPPAAIAAPTYAAAMLPTLDAPAPGSEGGMPALPSEPSGEEGEPLALANTADPHAVAPLNVPAPEEPALVQQHNGLGATHEAAYTLPEPPAPPPQPVATASRPLVASQAIHVIVWRDASGIRIARRDAGSSAQSPPATVDAMLVALDPSANLATWLSDE